jgi:hypothetical protein
VDTIARPSIDPASAKSMKQVRLTPADESPIGGITSVVPAHQHKPEPVPDEIRKWRILL